MKARGEDRRPIYKENYTWLDEVFSDNPVWIAVNTRVVGIELLSPAHFAKVVNIHAGISPLCY